MAHTAGGTVDGFTSNIAGNLANIYAQKKALEAK
jgi:hypothetical protein